MLGLVSHRKTIRLHSVPCRPQQLVRRVFIEDQILAHSNVIVFRILISGHPTVLLCHGVLQEEAIVGFLDGRRVAKASPIVLECGDLLGEGGEGEYLTISEGGPNSFEILEWQHPGKQPLKT